MEEIKKSKKKQIIEDTILVSTVGGAMVGAQLIDNKVPGYYAPLVNGGIGVTALIWGPKVTKPAAALLTGYGILSAVKKLVFKPETRRTGILMEIEMALPGNVLEPKVITEELATTEGKQTIADRIKNGVQKVKLSLGMQGADEDIAKSLGGRSMGGFEDFLKGDNHSESLVRALSGATNGIELAQYL